MSVLTLTDRESRRLKSLEDTIRRSAGDMYDAMRAIHDEKLYRDEFTTWEAYCRSRWNMSATNAYRLIEHGRILALLSEDGKEVSPIGEISEAATREVAALPDEQKVEVIREVAAESKSKNNGKPKVTAASVKSKVKEIGARLVGKKKKSTELSCAKEVDGLTKKYVSPLVRGIDAVAEMNGGKGDCHRAASNSLDDLIAAMRRMRGGER